MNEQDWVVFFQAIANKHELGIEITDVRFGCNASFGAENYIITAKRQTPRAIERWEGYWCGNPTSNSLCRGWGCSEFIYNEDGSVTRVMARFR